MGIKFTSREIKDKIRDKYGTQRKYADKLGISEDALSHKIARMSSDFKKQLEEDGVIIREPEINYKADSSFVLQMMDEMKKLMEQNKLLQKEVEELKEQNAKLSVLVDQTKITGTSTSVNR